MGYYTQAGPPTRGASLMKRFFKDVILRVNIGVKLLRLGRILHRINHVGTRFQLCCPEGGTDRVGKRKYKTHDGDEVEEQCSHAEPTQQQYRSVIPHGTLL